MKILWSIGHGASHYSDEMSSMRTPPKAEGIEPKLPQGIEMGLRFGPSEEMWHDKAQKAANRGDHPSASGPGPYFPGPLQVQIDIYIGI